MNRAKELFLFFFSFQDSSFCGATCKVKTEKNAYWNKVCFRGFFLQSNSDVIDTNV